MRRTLPPLLLINLLPHQALADCPSVDLWLGRVEQDIVALRLSQAAEGLTSAEAGFSCGAPATTAQVARFWRAEGVLLTIQERSEEARYSFAAARRLEPEVWTPAFGSEMEGLFRAASALDDPPSTVMLQPWDPRYQAWIDGRATTFPVQIDSGLHLVQASRSPRASAATVEYGKLTLVSGGGAMTLKLPFQADPGRLAEDSAPARGARALISGGAASALAGGALLWLGARLNDEYPATVASYGAGDIGRAEALDEVTGIHRAQLGLGVGGGVLAAAGAGAIVVGVIRW